jgi:ribosomal silencing factor RsfS
MLTLPITKKSKQQEWETILTTAPNNAFPTHIIHNLKKKLKAKKQQQQHKTLNIEPQQSKKWVIFTYKQKSIHRTIRPVHSRKAQRTHTIHTNQQSHISLRDAHTE